jgi:hypothetical protein
VRGNTKHEQFERFNFFGRELCALGRDVMKATPPMKSVIIASGLQS